VAFVKLFRPLDVISNVLLRHLSLLSAANSLEEIDKAYQLIADLGVKLKALREENSCHGQVIQTVLCYVLPCPL